VAGRSGEQRMSIAVRRRPVGDRLPEGGCLCRPVGIRSGDQRASYGRLLIPAKLSTRFLSRSLCRPARRSLPRFFQRDVVGGRVCARWVASACVAVARGRIPTSSLRRYKTLLSERMVVPLRSGLIIIPYDALAPSPTFTTRECPA